MLFDKTYRILNLLERFNKGEVINKHNAAKLYNVDSKTIQRDIAYINEYLEADKKTKIIYSKQSDGYVMNGRSNLSLSDSDIYAITKILLDSRAFSNDEIKRMVNSFLCLCDNAPKLKELILNELYYYVPTKQNRSIAGFLWQIADSVNNHIVSQITYERQDGVQKSREVKPCGIVFNEYYFYLIANICGIDKKHPAVFRIDRITNFKQTDQKFFAPHKDKFKEGEYRKRIHFMYMGDIIHIQFKFFGDSLNAVLDRIPTAKVVGYDGNKAIIEAEVYSNGIVRWLLSQREFLEVTKPLSLRNEMRETALKIAELYK